MCAADTGSCLCGSASKRDEAALGIRLPLFPGRMMVMMGFWFTCMSNGTSAKVVVGVCVCDICM